MAGEYLFAPNRVAKSNNLAAAFPDPQIWAQIRDKLATIPFNEIPAKLGLPRPYGPSELLWCCWVVGKDKTFDFFANPDKADVFDISHCSKLTVSELPEVLETALLLPLEIAEKMAVVEVFDSEGNTELALAVGSNYQGIMPVDIIDIISRFFFDGRHPTWALNGPCTDVETYLPLTEEQCHDAQVFGTDWKLSWQTDLDGSL